MAADFDAEPVPVGIWNKQSRRNSCLGFCLPGLPGLPGPARHERPSRSSKAGKPGTDHLKFADLDKLSQTIPTKYGFMGYVLRCFFASAIPCAASVVLFSDMGWGEDVYSFLVQQDVVASVLGNVALMILFMLYMLDFFWPPHLPNQYCALFEKDRCVGRSILGAAAVLLFFSALCIAKLYPTVPIKLTAILGPAFVLGLRVFVLSSNEESQEPSSTQAANRELLLRNYVGSEADVRCFYAAACLAFLMTGVLCLTSWTLWAWRVQRYLTVDPDLPEDWDAARELQYLRWVSPLAIGVAYLMFGCIVYLRVMLARTYDTAPLVMQSILEAAESQTVEEDHDNNNDNKPNKQTNKLTRASTTTTVQSQQQKGIPESIVARHLEGDGTLDAFKQMSPEQQQVFARTHLQSLKQVSRVVRMVGSVFLLMLGTGYVVLQVMAADHELAQLLLGFLFLGFCFFFVFLYVSFRRLVNAMSDWCYEMPVFRLAVSVAQSDVARSVFLFFFLPLVPVVFSLSWANQMIRRCRGLYKTIPAAASKPASTGLDSRSLSKSGVDIEDIDLAINPQNSCLTERVMSQVRTMQSWNWLDIILNLYIIGICMVMFTLSPRLLNVLLAWLNSALANLDFFVVILSVLCVGVLCFMLPPVPGVPVYVFAGIVIPQTCPYGFEIGCVVAIGVGFVLKTLACAVQQKCIGEVMGMNIKIRRQVGVNKPFIRAIEAVLRRQGMSTGKVAILCGGPDWPTSVLAGVLKLSLWEMELGTTPMLLFITPCSLSGSFYLKAAESELYARLGSLMLTVTVIIGSFVQLVAAWCIQSELDNNPWEMTKPLEQNLELDWMDYRSEQIQSSFVMKWGEVPAGIRFVTVAFALVEVLIGQFVFWKSNESFGNFEVTSDIADLVLYGEAGLFKPLGCGDMIASVACFVGYYCLKCHLDARRKKPFAVQAALLDSTEGKWKEERLRVCRECATRSPTVIEVLDGYCRTPPSSKASK
mmetsp:Transcript_67424/g.121500  ORF Transcript_67424/g.121500 Transcript_67424/m.121500 type:complete len:986 (+) Transcript_67424:69-3026(+)